MNQNRPYRQYVKRVYIHVWLDEVVSERLHIPEYPKGFGTTKDCYKKAEAYINSHLMPNGEPMPAGASPAEVYESI